MSRRRIAWQDGEDRVQRWIEGWVENEASLSSELLHRSPQRSLFRIESSKELLIDSSGKPSVRELVIKIHHTASGRHRQRERIKRHIGYAPALREWSALVDLHAARVTVPEPLAWGILPNGDALLATEHFPGRGLISTLDEGSPAERLEWIERLAAAVSSLHRAGFRHGDLHLGNLHAFGERVAILDVQRARPVGGRREQLDDLAQLDFSIARRGFGIDCRRRLKAALGNPRGLDTAARRFVHDFIRGRTRRELKVGENWESWRFEAPADPDVLDAARSFVGVRIRSAVASRLENALYEAIADSRPGNRRSGRTRVTTHNPGDSPVIIKRTTLETPRQELEERLRDSAALRSFRTGQRLALLGDLGARTLAAVDESRDGRPVANWLILDAVGRCDLDAYRPDSQDVARRCLIALASWISEWHAWGIHHTDLKAGNIRVDDRAGEFAFWLIDLADVRFRRRLRDEDRARALVQLNASLSDDDFSLEVRREALDTYLERLPFARYHQKALIDSLGPRSIARRHRWIGLGCEATRPALAGTGAPPDEGES